MQIRRGQSHCSRDDNTRSVVTDPSVFLRRKFVRRLSGACRPAHDSLTHALGALHLRARVCVRSGRRSLHSRVWLKVLFYGLIPIATILAARYPQIVRAVLERLL
jgi:hypothetical protein